MPIGLALRATVVAALLSLTASLPVDQGIQTSLQTGKTRLSNAEIIDYFSDPSSGTIVEKFCRAMPSAWEEGSPDDSWPGLEDNKNEGGCTLVKAQTCVSLACYPTSSVHVCNPHDEDLCLADEYPGPPTPEYMKDICDNAPFPSGMWVEGGLRMGYMCGKWGFEAHTPSE